MFGDSSQHAMANFLIVMKSKHVVSVRGVMQLNVKSFLRDYSPTFSEKRSLHQFGLGARPLAHADTGRILIDSGMSLDFSTSSAIA
jgi:hypothetical protein